MRTEVLSTEQIERIVTRIAYQIVEALDEESDVTILGLKPRGVWVANRISDALGDISKVNVSVEHLDLNDSSHQVNYSGKVVVLCDDIVNSGRSMMLAAGIVSTAGADRLLTACLVDRKHRRFPIQIDFTGQSLATTLKEKLSLILDENPNIILE